MAENEISSRALRAVPVPGEKVSGRQSALAGEWGVAEVGGEHLERSRGCVGLATPPAVSTPRNLTCRCKVLGDRGSDPPGYPLAGDADSRPG